MLISLSLNDSARNILNDVLKMYGLVTCVTVPQKGDLDILGPFDVHY